jgi:hypothetical protein
MYEQIQNQIATISKQFTQNIQKANELLLANAETTMALQMKTFEERMNANLAFWGAAAESRDAEGVQAVLPKGVQLLKDNAERVYQTSQQIIAGNLKTSEAIAELIKVNVQAANDGVTSAIQQNVKTAKSAAK